MSTKASTDALVLGAGPGALAIAAALAKEDLKVDVLSKDDPATIWPYTYGIWGEEVDELGLNDLLEHRWSNTVSFFGSGSLDESNHQNIETPHEKDYGLFDKKRLQNYWIKQCNDFSVNWHQGQAHKFAIDDIQSTVTTKDGIKFSARLIIDATGYNPVFLKVKNVGQVAVQTCYGVVGSFNKAPVKQDQFVLMDYRCDHLSEDEKSEPPTFLYAMDMGNGKYFLEETSLGLFPPLKLEQLRSRLKKRLAHRGIEITTLDHEELGLFLPMNLPIPDRSQSILGFGGSAGMVHPASGYMVGSLLRRAPIVAKALADAMQESDASPAEIAAIGWNKLWPLELRRKQALYKFGLEKLIRFEEDQLRDFFRTFFTLPSNEWYGFLTNTLTISELVNAMIRMFFIAPWSVRKGLMSMKGREINLLWDFINPPK